MPPASFTLERELASARAEPSSGASIALLAKGTNPHSRGRAVALLPHHRQSPEVPVQCHTRGRQWPRWRCQHLQGRTCHLPRASAHPGDSPAAPCRVFCIWVSGTLAQDRRASLRLSHRVPRSASLGLQLTGSNLFGCQHMTNQMPSLEVLSSSAG